MALHECGQPAAVGRVDFVQIYHHVKFAAVDEQAMTSRRCAVPSPSTSAPLRAIMYFLSGR